MTATTITVSIEMEIEEIAGEDQVVFDTVVLVEAVAEATGINVADLTVVKTVAVAAVAAPVAAPVAPPVEALAPVAPPVAPPVEALTPTPAPVADSTIMIARATLGASAAELAAASAVAAAVLLVVA